MRLLFILTTVLLTNCSKPKTVLICGDHVCVNQAEANQYFEENLSIEVKIIDNKIKKKIDLVELNLKDKNEDNRKIGVTTIQKTKKEIKILSKDEIIKIKKNIENKQIQQKIARKIPKKQKKNKKLEKEKIEKSSKFKDVDVKKKAKYVNKNSKDLVDVCTVLEKCNIEEISKYLIKKGKNKDYPNISLIN